MRILSRALATAPVLKSLDLSGVSMFDEGKQYLIQALRTDRQLARLRLAHSNVNGDQIVEALDGHPSLVCLE